MFCIRSLPGESASRDRVVTSPYTTAQAAQTRATTTPWFVRKLLNRNPPRSDWRAARGCSRAHLSHGSLDTSAYPAQTRGQSIVLAGNVPASAGCARRISASGHPQPAARLGGAGTTGLLLGRRRGRIRGGRSLLCGRIRRVTRRGLARIRELQL